MPYFHPSYTRTMINFRYVLAALLFPFCLAGCHPARKAMTPAEELKRGVADAGQREDFLRGLLQSQPAQFDSILREKDRYRVQIIYTRIDRDADNRPSFTHFYYNVDPAQYFYPASTVKLPVAALALQRLHELGLPGLDRDATMITQGTRNGLPPVFNEPTAPDGRPTVGHYVRKIFLASDNDAYNRLFEFLGQEYINGSLQKMGYDSVQILHRLNLSLPDAQQRITGAVNFYDTAGRLLYNRPAWKSGLAYQPRATAMGTGFMRGGVLINEPFDFSLKNRLSLPDLHSMLTALMFPETVPARQRFSLAADDLQFLRRAMAMKPRESRFPSYDSSYGDAYVKFLLLGGAGPMPGDGLRIFNKAGDAYGFLTDAAYVADFANGVEFLLSATIYCNADGVFNDDRYDYQTVGLPFLKNLGQLIYNQERQRMRKHRPDLSAFKMNYAE